MLQPVGLQRVGHNLATEQQHVIIRHCTGSDWRKKRQLLQCPCLESPRDRGAWWAAVHGVAQSWTRLKRLSSSSSRQVMSTPQKS